VPGCIGKRWLNGAALVPIEPLANRRLDVPRRGDTRASDCRDRRWTAGWCLRRTAAIVSASLSRAKVERVGDYVRNEIATGKIPGAVILVQQHGHPVYFESFGARDVASQLPMTADSIFRLYSMSKPVTSVAAMMLVEDGKLRLDDPVSKIHS